MSYLYPQAIDAPLDFPLEGCGYLVTNTLNNKNRWHTKLVCKVCNGSSQYLVATTYKQPNEYLEFIRVIGLLEANKRLVPKIVKFYPYHNTVICNFIGEFFSEFLVENPNYLKQALVAVFSYLKAINSINQVSRTLTMPSIITMSIQLARNYFDNFDFLPNIKNILPKLEKANIQFNYGCGIEDPHIWNFRILKESTRIQALTTDFDYFSNQVNYFWELGYFYATFRWIKKNHYSLSLEAEKILLSFVRDKGEKPEFMFWLGVVSSYCGYRDSLLALSVSSKSDLFEFKEQQDMIKLLDQKVAYLAQKILGK